MKIEKIILNILKKIESMGENVIAYSYLSGNESMTNVWYEISISDYQLYTDKRFKLLCRAWYKVAESQGVKMIFVCGFTPSEKRLVDLYNDNNLILNI